MTRVNTDANSRPPLPKTSLLTAADRGDTSELLLHVTHTATVRDEARDYLTAAIKCARQSGATLEEIAQAAGLSRQRVHQILKEEK